MDRLRTPDMPLGGLLYRNIILTIPANADMERFISGALSGIGFFTAWEEYGTMSPEDAAFIMKRVYLSMRSFDMLGMIFPIYLETVPDTMLLCDGGVYDKSDYPQLWELLPIGAKGATDFTTPDLRDSFIIGAGSTYTEGDTGGESEVTLDESQIPSHSHTNFPHSHSEVIAVPALADLGTGVPVPSAVPAVGVTGAASISIDPTGGGLAHNNLPPYFALRYAMIAKVNP